MIDVETLKRLAEYNAWADQTLFDAMKKLPKGTVYEETKTLFKSMVGTLNHNYQVDLIWQAHLTGSQHGFTSRRDILHPRFEDLILAQHEANLWYVSWASEQSPDDCNCQFQLHFRDACANAKRPDVSPCDQSQDLSSRLGQSDVF
jgi:uncharacterized damage-inducible protein DinB